MSVALNAWLLYLTWNLYASYRRDGLIYRDWILQRHVYLTKKVVNGRSVDFLVLVLPFSTIWCQILHPFLFSFSHHLVFFSFDFSPFSAIFLWPSFFFSFVQNCSSVLEFSSSFGAFEWKSVIFFN